MNRKTIIVLLAVAGVLTFRVKAQDHGTNDAQTNFFPFLCCSNRAYTNATLENITPATVTVFWDGGGERIPFTNLPLELQARFYDPQEAEKIRVRQAADSVARTTFGPVQKIRILNTVWNNQFQIEAGGKVAQAYITNLPLAVVTFLNDLNQTKLRIISLKAQLATDLADAQSAPTGGGGALNGGGGFYTASRDQQVRNSVAWANLNAADARDHARAAAAKAKTDTVTLNNAQSHLVQLENLFDARCTVMARPTAFIVSGLARQWEYQGAPIFGTSTGETTPSHTQPQSNPPLRNSSQWSITGTVRKGDVQATLNSVGFEVGQFIICLRLSNLSNKKKVDFTSWAAPQSEGGGATLTDNNQNTYKRNAYPSIEGLTTYQCSIYPGQSADVRLSFEKPVDNLEWLHLELPAENFGGSGVVRFEIPKSSIIRSQNSP